jgi:hypothetical protein
MPKDRVTGGHQGYGFVEMLGEEDAEYALKVRPAVLSLCPCLCKKWNEWRRMGTSSWLFSSVTPAATTIARPLVLALNTARSRSDIS